ncbi:major facilitator superfamily domain-containing protein [Aspergillus multicolor]|uniref:major facilitator superfamily domain-containing protein n=1 Tax=Aspergillus multicolor TaxID=41759 RepID=UPI003CCDE0C4
MIGTTSGHDHRVEGSTDYGQHGMDIPPGHTIGDDDLIYPEGGFKGWLCVLAYLESHQLRDYVPGDDDWVFSVFTFLTFFAGLQVGPIFDAQGPRLLLVSGSVLTMVMTIGMSFCEAYWQFMLAIGITGGLGVSLIFTPSLAAVGHYFYAKRGAATGISAAGGAVVALISLVGLVFACLSVTPRLPPKELSLANALADLRILRDTRFLLTTLAIFLIEWGLFVSLNYVSSYSLAARIKTSLSYDTLAILNAGSVLGRWLPGYIAGKVGRFNTLIATVAMCLICNACL